MQGFFSRKETESISSPSGKPLSCIACGLYKNCDSPKMEPFGNYKKSIINIGEFPSETDDSSGKTWQGKEGRLLKRAYKKLGIDLFEDCLNLNSVNCNPGKEKNKTKTPTEHEINCCRKRVLRIIKEYQPKLIMLFGIDPVKSIIGYRWKKDLGGIFKWHGWTIPDKDFKCWICPTFHPGFVQAAETEVETVWERDLKRALNKAEEPLPKYPKPEMEFIEDLSVLNGIPNGAMVAIDYETTGLKPHAKGHRIVCAVVADSENHCWVFMMPEKKKDRKPFIDLLQNPSIAKIAQNMKFEDTWSNVRLKTDVKGWEWDTMLATHIMDNRSFITGLKFQTYVQFGVVDYSSEVDPYLKGKEDKNANSLNRVEELIRTEAGKQKLLTYCGWDGIWEYRLAMKQINELNYDFLPF